MQIVIDNGDGRNNEFLAAWAAKRIGAQEFAKPLQCIGVMRDGKLAAVAVYNHYLRYDGGANIMVHFASDNPRWATREAVRMFLSYPYYNLGCNRITAFVPKNNRRSRRLVYGLGFKPEGAMRAAAPGARALCIYGLLKDEFEAGKYGHEQRRAVSAAAA